MDRSISISSINTFFLSDILHLSARLPVIWRTFGRLELGSGEWDGMLSWVLLMLDIECRSVDGVMESCDC